MKVNPIPTQYRKESVAAGLAAVDTRVQCSGECASRGMRVSLWYVLPRWHRGEIAGWDGTCALCGHQQQLPVERIVPALRPAHG